MIDLLFKAADKVIELLKYRDERNRRTYSQIAEPIYVALSAVHSGYIGMLEEALQDLRKNLPLEDIAENMARASRVNEAVRRGIYAALKDGAAHDDKILTFEFYQVCCDYFNVDLAQSRVPSTPGTTVIGWLRKAIRVEDQQERRKILLSAGNIMGIDDVQEVREILDIQITNTLAKMRAQWETISIVHARLRKECLGK